MFLVYLEFLFGFKGQIIVNSVLTGVNVSVALRGWCFDILVSHKIAKHFLPKIITSLRNEGVEVRGCPQTKAVVHDVVEATEEDWYTEYLDLIIGIKIVNDIAEAINHINKYGTKHSDAILTANFNKALQFIREVDSAAVYWNASTRFTDGNQYGL
ncbi:unnamed protein product, partial [marine sediment metagenome]